MKIRASIAILLLPVFAMGTLVHYDTMTSLGTNAGIVYYELPLGCSIYTPPVPYDPYADAVWCAVKSGWTDEIGSNDLFSIGAATSLVEPTNSFSAVGVFPGGVSYAQDNSNQVDELKIQEFSVAGWMKIDAFETAATLQTLMSMTRDPQTTFGWNLYYLETANVVEFSVDKNGGGDWVKTSSRDMTENVWQYLVATFDSTNLLCYLDGVPGSATACSKLTYYADTVLTAGSLSTTSAEDLIGQASQLAIYDYALSSNTINSNMIYTAWGGGTHGMGTTEYLFNNPDNIASNCLVCYSFDTDQDLAQNWAQQVSHADNGDRSASGTTWTDDGTNTWLDFDGTNGYVDSADIGTVKTISFWINPDDVTDRKIINIDGTDQIELNASSNIVATSFPAATIYTNGVAGAGPLTADVWTHVCITDSTGVSASTFEVGKVGASYYDGAIDDVYAFSTELTAGQIVNLTENGSHYAP